MRSIFLVLLEVLFILLFSFPVTASYDDGGQALREASADGDVDKIKQLLQDGVYAGAASAEGETPLHLTCIHGYANAQLPLIEAGANLDARSTGEKSLRMTPLTWCAYGGHLQAVENLLTAGADPNLVVDDEQGNLITVLDIAHRIGQGAGDVIAELLETFGAKTASSLVGSWKRAVAQAEKTGGVLSAAQPQTLAGKEGKHVPLLTVQSERVGGGTYDADREEAGQEPEKRWVATVTVPHAMSKEHMIQYVYAKNEHEEVVAIEEIQVSRAPSISFVVPAGTSQLTAFEYCNLHGVWKSEPLSMS